MAEWLACLKHQTDFNSEPILQSTVKQDYNHCLNHSKCDLNRIRQWLQRFPILAETFLTSQTIQTVIFEDNIFLTPLKGIRTSLKEVIDVFGE